MLGVLARIQIEYDKDVMPKGIRTDYQALVGTTRFLLTVLAVDKTENQTVYLKCRCDCGRELLVRGPSLTSGNTRSCGCLLTENRHQRGTREKSKNPPEYGIWVAMLQRCYNPKHSAYPNYGGRGISVCDEWRHDFKAFFAAMGSRPTPKHAIDRKDNSMGYGPDNCKWATATEQHRNTRRNHYVIYRGTRYTISSLAEHVGMNGSTLSKRILRDKLSVEEAISRPLQARTYGSEKLF
jgi:hypothetical protein